MSLNTADLLSLKGVCLPFWRPPPPRSPHPLRISSHSPSSSPVINPVLMAYSFCSSAHISLVYFPVLVNLGTCHKRSDIRAIISGNYQITPSPPPHAHIHTLLLLLLLPHVKGKKKKKWHLQERLRGVCRKRNGQLAFVDQVKNENLMSSLRFSLPTPAGWRQLLCWPGTGFDKP